MIISVENLMENKKKSYLLELSEFNKFPERRSVQKLVTFVPSQQHQKNNQKIKFLKIPFKRAPEI